MIIKIQGVIIIKTPYNDKSFLYECFLSLQGVMHICIPSSLYAYFI